MAKHLSTDQHRRGHWGTEAWSFCFAREFLLNISSICGAMGEVDVTFILQVDRFGSLFVL